MTPNESQDAGRCAVIFNPTKVEDGFQERAAAALAAAGYTEPLWLPTKEDDPGHSMAREAREAGVDLVLAAGGDGTVRIVADGLAGSDIAMGIIPAGTGNLLARNLGLPQSEAEALATALDSHRRRIDLLKVIADDREPEHFAVLAGTGVDAMIMDETDPRLKAAVGPAAYFVAAAKALGRLPVGVTIQLDDHRPRHRKAMIVLVGNVGQLRGGLNVLPRAQPDDGLLDVFVASPHRLRDWVRVVARVIARRARRRDTVETLRGRRVRIQLDEPDNYELDGDMVGECRRLEIEVVPGALLVCGQPPTGD